MLNDKSAQPLPTQVAEVGHDSGMSDLSKEHQLPRVGLVANPAEYALQRLVTLLQERGVDATSVVPRLKNRLAPFITHAEQGPGEAHVTPTVSIKGLPETVPSLAILALAPQIAQLRTQHERLTVIRELLAPGISDPFYRNFICLKLPHLIHFLSTKERSHLLTHALSFESKKVQAKVAFAVVRSARTRRELMSLISEKRARRLGALRHPELKELVAKALLRRAFRDLEIPPSLSSAYAGKTVEQPRVAARVVRARMAELQSILKSHLQVLKTYPNLEKTRTAREYRCVIKDSLRRLSPYVAESDTLPTIHISRHRGAKLTNLLIKKVSCELEFGIHLRNGHPHNSHLNRPWQIKDIKTLKAALREIPEGHLEMAPGINDFFLSRRREYYGWRHDHGPIVLTDEHHHEISREFGGAPGRRVVIIHEIAHGLFSGRGERNTRFDPYTGEITSPGDPLFDFRSFYALSGWHVVTAQPKEWRYNKGVVAIADVEYAVGRPQEYNGKGVIFRTFEDAEEIGGGPIEHKRTKTIRLLLAHDPFAPFGRRENGWEEPAEDHAEGLAEYLEAPRRFSRAAPEKFLYYHLHFRAHSEMSPDVQYVYQTLTSSHGT